MSIELTTATPEELQGIKDTLIKKQVSQRLYFDEFDHFIIPSDSSIKNLGLQYTNLSIALPEESMPFKKSGNNYSAGVEVVLYEEFGGVNIDIGINVVAITNSNPPQIHQFIGQGSRVNENADNYGIHKRTFNVQFTSSDPIEYVKIEVIGRRLIANEGNTKIVGAYINITEPY